MLQTDELSLRPRLTICKDLHPELFEIFSRTPANRHNALVMQMLIRMATIDFHGAMPMHRNNRFSQNPSAPTGREHSTPLVPPSDRAAKKAPMSAAQQNSDHTSPQVDEVDTNALLLATGGMFTT